MSIILLVTDEFIHLENEIIQGSPSGHGLSNVDNEFSSCARCSCCGGFSCEAQLQIQCRHSVVNNQIDRPSALFISLLNFPSNLNQPSLHHLRHSLQTAAEQKSHVASDIGNEATHVVDDVLLLLVIEPIYIVQVEVQSLLHFYDIFETERVAIAKKWLRVLDLHVFYRVGHRVVQMI